jgi:hypothetical protein
MFNARNLILQSRAHVTFLGKSGLVIPQFFEWHACGVELRRERTGERTRDVVQETQPIGNCGSVMKSMTCCSYTTNHP